MFKSLEIAQDTFSNIASDGLREVILSLLLPISVLVPSADQSASTLTFVGGTPTMSRQLEWPVPALPDDITTIADRGGPSHSKNIREALEAQLPYSFIGQIDLTKSSIRDLPNTGRLLFFYDTAVGPWDTSTRAAKVIWDTATIDQLTEFASPKALINAEADWNAQARAFVPQPIVIDEETRKLFLEAGMSEDEIDAMSDVDYDLPEHVDQRVYFGPKRSMQITTHYQVPNVNNLEWDTFAQTVTEKSANGLTAEALADIYIDHEIGYDVLVGFQLLGLPLPEQDDPRLDAAIPLLYDKQFLSQEEWAKSKAELTKEAQSLRLLFQVPIANWLQENTEGTVYFLIKDTDLKARNFDNVIAVYQQT